MKNGKKLLLLLLVLAVLVGATAIAGAISKKGHPHHPLYLRRDEPLRDFDVARYLDTF